MNRFAILCLDHDSAIVERLRHDLRQYATLFDVFCTDSLNEAEEAVAYLEQNQQKVALVICGNNHMQFKGVEFLIKLDRSEHTRDARKILLNDNLAIETIMSAVNEGRLDHCLTKPWRTEELLKVTTKELTTHLLNDPTADWLSYSSLLDQNRILKAHIDRKMSHYRAGFINDYHNIDDNTLANQVIDALYEFFSDNDETRACRTYSANHLLTKEGKQNRFLWFIAEGEVALYKTSEDNQQHEVIRYHSGNIVGGMSFVTGEDSFSTAITLSKTKVIKLDRELFAKVMHTKSDLLPLFTNLLLRHFNRRLQGSIKTKLQLQQTLVSLESAHQQLIEREKMAVLGQLVAGVAHELNNPVAAILRGSDTLKESVPHVLRSSLQPEQYQQGIKIMDQAMLNTPTSTADARKAAKQIEHKITDRNLAKKLVQLGLNDPTELNSYISALGSNLKKTVQEWEHFYQTGNILRSINVCALRIADMVKSLKSYARQDEETTFSVDIHEGIEDTLVIFENRLKRYSVTKQYAKIPNITCQPIALQQVWTNLISNALDALPSDNHGELIITTEFESKEFPSSIVVTFHDNGHGIPDDIQDKIFELNYTTKSEGNFGLGIGLSVCQQIIKQHGGHIHVKSELGKYSKMIVVLPINTAQHTQNTSRFSEKTNNHFISRNDQ